MNASDRKRLEAVLPFYVNGRAEEQDRAFVETLAQNSEVRAMLDWHEGLAEKVQVQVDSVNDRVGWAGLMSKVRAQQKPVEKENPPRWGWFSLDRWLVPSFQGPAFAAMLLVVAVQSFFLYGEGGNVAQDGDYGAMRGVAGGVAPSLDTATLKINFKDETSEHELRMLLIATGASIVQGPGQLGDYILNVPADRVDAAMQELRTSKWVNSVRLVKPSGPSP